jgi:hypothetical protein
MCNVLPLWKRVKAFGSHLWGHKWKVVAFFAVWLVLGLIARRLVAVGNGYWIELFNGATWPEQFIVSDKRPTPMYDVWFYMVVSLRALLNLGVLFTAFVAVFLFVTGQWKGLLMDKFNSTYRTANTTLAERILHILEEHDVVVPPPVEEIVRQEARNFSESEGAAFIRDRMKAAALAAAPRPH